MGMKFANNATTVLASGINSSVTSLTVTTGQGALFPSLSGGDYFYCTLANVVGTVEIIKVTARSTDTFTIVRGQDNTLAASWIAGDKVELRLVAATLNDLPKLDEANTFSGAQTLSAGTANGVAYLNGSKVLTTGSALVFDGTNLGVGVTPSSWGSGQKALEMQGGSVWSTTTTNMQMMMNVYNNGTNYIYKNSNKALMYSQDTTVGHTWYNVPSGTAGATATLTQAMTLNASGQLNLNSVGSASGDAVLDITQAGFGQTAVFYQCGSGSPNAATAALKTWTAASGRSINASGTINASGADYAEYMTKAGDFTVAKGDVVGINSEGKLTNVFADAISFVVKSTDPSYVGGDVWGTETALGMELPKQPVQRQGTEDAETDEEFAVRQAQYESDKTAFNVVLEAARQTVDRIAFAGQVPVNVTGATAGQYIVPVNDNGAIKGEAVSNPTFEQYQQSVGKVIAIEQDGRARIIVKVA
jgi:hypothetical protein